MRRLLSLLLVVAVGGCGGGGEPAGGADRFTQGGVSMEPAVKPGQVVAVRAIGHDYTPQRGDIVLFHPDGERWGGNGAPYLKRVIGLAGETVACCDPSGKVTIDGTPLDEPYVAKNAPLDTPPNENYCGARRFGPVAVTAGTVFVMGDNRANSNDSRCAGPIPVASVFAVMTS